MTSPRRLESVCCAVCGSSSSEHAHVKDGFHIVRCRECGLYYVNPRLRQSVLTRMYNTGEISPDAYYKETCGADQKTFLRRLELIERTLGKTGTILDIGCTIGTLLFLAQRRGWTCYGLDINASVKKYFKDSGISLKIGDVLHTSYRRSFFDVVVMNDLLEHVSDPYKLLVKVRSWLKGDGLLFLVTPDGGSTMFSLLGQRWFHLKPNEHLYYFTRQSLSMLFQKAGYELFYLRHLGRYRSLRMLARKSLPVFGPLAPVMERVVHFLHVDSLTVPLNLWDEYGVMARKRALK